ncbi:MAG: PEP-CTERM sorting domain-containing protein [Cyanophyceae cyanobacterium]
MNKNSLLAALTGAVCLSVGSGAFNQANAVTFNFSGSGGFANSFTFTEEGLSVTATASNVTAGETIDAQVTQNSAGLGVFAGDVDENLRVDGDLEGSSNGQTSIDTLDLTFDTEVFFSSATFTRIDSSDEFDLSIDDGETERSELNPVGNGTVTVDFPSLRGSTFSFSATDFNDGYRLQQVEAAIVPEPLTILGAGTALGFGIAFKKRASKKS